MDRDYIINVVLKARDDMGRAFAEATAEMQGFNAMLKEQDVRNRSAGEANEKYVQQLNRRITTEKKLEDQLKSNKLGSAEAAAALLRLRNAQERVTQAERQNDPARRAVALRLVVAAEKALTDELVKSGVANKGLATIQANRISQEEALQARIRQTAKEAQKDAADQARTEQQLTNTLNQLRNQAERENHQRARQRATFDAAEARARIAREKQVQREIAADQRRADAEASARRKATAQQEAEFARITGAAYGPARTLARTDINQRQEIQATNELARARALLIARGHDEVSVDRALRNIRQDALRQTPYITQAARDEARLAHDQAAAYEMVANAAKKLEVAKRSSSRRGPTQTVSREIANIGTTDVGDLGRQFEVTGGLLDRLQSRFKQLDTNTSGFLGKIKNAVVFALIPFIQPLIFLITGLVGTMGALASAAVAAGAAIGVTFLSGIAQAVPAIGVFAAAMQRLQSVFSLVSTLQGQVQQRFIAGYEAAQQSAIGVNQVAIAQHNYSNALFAAQTAVQNISVAEHARSDALFSLQQAERNVGVTELNLRTTRQQAIRQLQDLVTQENNARLAAEASSKSVGDAQKALRAAIATGGDVQGAQIDLAQAQAAHSQAVTQAQRSIADAAPGSIARQNITQQVQQGQQAVVQARRAVTDAHFAYQQAQQGVVQAQRAVVDAQFQIAQARAAIIQAQQAAAGYNLATAAQLAYLRATMSKTELALADNIRRILGLFESLPGHVAKYRAITDAILGAFVPLTDRIYHILNDPKVYGALLGLARSIGGAIRTITGALTSNSAVTQWVNIINAAATNIAPLARIAVDLFKALASVIQVTLPNVHDLLGFISGLVHQFSVWATSVEGKKWLKNFFDEAFTSAKAFVGLGVAILQLIAAIIGRGGGAAQGVSLIQQLTGTVRNLTDDINNHGKAWHVLQQIWGTIQPTISALAAVFGALGRGIIELTGGTQGSSGLNGMARLLSQFLIPAFVTFAQTLGAVAGKVSDFLSHHQTLARMLTDMLVVSGLVALALKAGGLLFGPLAGGIKIISGLVGGLKRLFGFSEASKTGDTIAGRLKAAAGGIGTTIGRAFNVETRKNTPGGSKGPTKTFGNAVEIIAPIHETAQAVRVWVVNGGGGLGGGGGGLSKAEKNIEQVGSDAAQAEAHNPSFFRRMASKVGEFTSKIPGAGVVANAGSRLAEVGNKARSVATRAFPGLEGAISKVGGHFGLLAGGAFAAYAALTHRGGLKDKVLAAAQALDPTQLLHALGLPALTDPNSPLLHPHFGVRPAPFTRTPGTTVTNLPVPSAAEQRRQNQENVTASIFGTPGRTSAGDSTGGRLNLNFLPQLANTIRGAVPNIRGQSQKLGQSVHDGLSAGVKNVQALGHDTANRFIAAVRRDLGIASPSKVMETIGQQVLAGLKNGVDNIQSVGGSLVNQLLLGAQNNWTKIRSIGASLGDWISAGFGNTELTINKLWANTWGDLGDTTQKYIRQEETLFSGYFDKVWNGWWTLNNNLNALNTRFWTQTNQTTSDQLNKLWTNFDTIYNKVDVDTFNAFWYIAHAANQSLKSFGAKPVDVSIGKQPTFAKAATGGFLGMAGERGKDAVHAVLGRGEAVLNYAHQALVEPAMNAYYGFGLNKMFQRVRGEHAGDAVGYAAGGPVGGVNYYGHPSDVSPFLVSLMRLMESKFPGLIVTATRNGGHANSSYHYLGEAVDFASGNYGLMNQAAQWVTSSGLYRSLAEGIHNPNLSVKYGQAVPSSYWGAATWGEHANHIHLAITNAIGQIAKVAGSFVGAIRGAGTVSPWHNIREQSVTGRGVLANLLRATIHRVTGAANAFGQSHAGAAGAPGDLGGPVTGAKGYANAKKWTEQAMRLAGVSGGLWENLLLRQEFRESGYNPNAINNTDINAQRGDPSRGILQTIGSTFRHYALPGYNKNIYDPISNIIAGIRYMIARYGGGNADRAAQVMWNRGGGAYKLGGFVDGAVPILAHAGEWVLNKAQQYKLGGWLGAAPNKIANALGFTGGPDSFAGGGIVRAADGLPGLDSIGGTGNALLGAVQQLTSAVLILARGFGPTASRQGVFSGGQVSVLTPEFQTTSVSVYNRAQATTISRLQGSAKRIDDGIKQFLANWNAVSGDNGPFALAEQAIQNFINRQQSTLQLLASGIRIVNHRLRRTQPEGVVQAATRDFNATLQDITAETALRKQQVIAIGQINREIARIQREGITKANVKQYQDLLGARQTMVNNIDQTDQDLAQAYSDRYTKTVALFQARNQQQLRGVTNRQTIATAQQSIAQTFGRANQLGGIDQTILNNAREIQNDLQRQYDDATRRARSDPRWQSVADDLLGQLESATQNVAQAMAQQLSDAISSQDTQTQMQQAANAVATSIAQTIGQFSDAIGSPAGQFRAIATQIGLSQSNTTSIQGQIANYTALQQQALAQNNVGAYNQLTQTIGQLNQTMQQSILQTQQLITSYYQLSTTLTNTFSQSSQGFIGAAQGIFQTIGQIVGNQNLPALIQSARDAAGVIAQAGAQAVGNINNVVQGGAGAAFGAASGAANTLLSAAAAAFQQGPQAFAAYLSANAGALGAFEAGLPPDEQALFHGLIQSLIDNTTANVNNTQQLQQLNATTNQQPFSSSAWTMFREAIFNGLGGLLPTYAMQVPSLDVGGRLMSSGMLYGHKDEVILPANVARGAMSGAMNQTNHFNIDHPVEVADPVLFGNSVAWRLSHDPNSR